MKKKKQKKKTPTTKTVNVWMEVRFSISKKEGDDR